MITFRQLQEKSVSKQQQQLMGLALAYKRGEVPAGKVSDQVKKLAKSMSDDELSKYAGTKHKGLPQKIADAKVKYKVGDATVYRHQAAYESVDEAVELDARRKTFKETMRRLNSRKQKLAEKEAKKMGPVEIGTNEYARRYAAMTPGQTNESLDEDGHTDVASSKRMTKTISDDAAAISQALGQMDNEGNLPTWWTNKLATSAKDMNSLNDYISNPTNEAWTSGYDNIARGAAAALAVKGAQAVGKKVKSAAGKIAQYGRSGSSPKAKAGGPAATSAKPSSTSTGKSTTTSTSTAPAKKSPSQDPRNIRRRERRAAEKKRKADAAQRKTQRASDLLKRTQARKKVQMGSKGTKR
jgi:hypothetical protein